MALPWWIPFGAVPEVAPEALHAALDGPEPPLVLDVRTSLEYAGGHVRGAVSVPVTELRARLTSLGLDPGRQVVAICLSAHRSIPAVRALREAGLDAAQLAGGMLAWRLRRLPETRD